MAVAAVPDPSPTPEVQLTPFGAGRRKRKVIGTSVAIRKAGDGLSSALAIDPVEFDHEEEFYVVLKCRVVKIRYDMVGDTGTLVRVHLADTEEATIIDGELVEGQLARQRELIEEDRIRREEEAGIQRLPMGAGGGQAIVKDPDADPLAPQAKPADDWEDPPRD